MANISACDKCAHNGVCFKKQLMGSLESKVRGLRETSQVAHDTINFNNSVNIKFNNDLEKYKLDIQPICKDRRVGHPDYEEDEE